MSELDPTPKLSDDTPIERIEFLRPISFVQSAVASQPDHMEPARMLK
jgi:hypothetical protein